MSAETTERQQAIFDAAVTDPGRDLLGINRYSERLAEFVATLEPPFTIGVYGRWGSGKSTFVRLMEAGLRKIKKENEFCFITFEAWPFKTADDLWRALVQKIAHALHEVGETKPEPAPVPPESFATRIGERLREPLLRFAPAPPPRKGELDDYHTLLHRLDNVRYGGLRRTKTEGQLVDEEGALTAVVQGTVAALGNFSPLVAAMRSFFGLGGNVDATQLLQKEKDEITRNRIQSVEDFRGVMDDLFKQKANGKLVCVFIDDLDRCMPEVAFDLLEALKIFLGHVQCIFIVAADAQLILEGLRIRYKDMPNSALIGMEYFEKIIQLGIRVPEHAAKDIHRFIAAQYPQWLAVTDFIQTVVGSNPRRLKQYCTQLDYKYMVARDPADGPDETLLNKLVELHWWSPEALEKLRLLAADPDFTAIAGRLETCLGKSKEGEPRTTAKEEIDHAGAQEIYDLAVQSAPLHHLFGKHPLFSQSAPTEIAAMSSFVDITPTAETMLFSKDRVLMRILEQETRTSARSEASLLIDDVTKLSLFDADDPGIAAILHQLALRDDWSEVMASVESSLAGGANAQQPHPAAQPLMVIAKAKIAVRVKLLDPQQLSSILPEIVRAWFPRRAPGATAQAIVDQIPQHDLAEITARLAARIRAARHFVRRRKFVKVDSLSHSWPELFQAFNTDRAGIRTFESNVIDPDQRTADLPERWHKYLIDDRLMAFLRLRPRLGDILDDDASTLVKLTESVVPVPEVVTPPAQPVVDVTPIVVRPESVAADFPVSPGLKPYSTMYIDISGIAGSYDVELRDEDGFTWRGTGGVSMADLDTLVAAFYQTAPGAEMSGKLRQFGRDLYRKFFTGDTDGVISDLLASGEPYRFALSMPADLMRLPWELLYVPPPFSLFLGLSTNYSIVRFVKPTQKLQASASPFTLPLKMVAFVSGLLNEFTEEESLLRRLFENNRLTLLEFLTGEEATYSDLERMLRVRRPQIVRLSNVTLQESGLIFNEPPNTTKWVPSLSLANLIHQSDVKLLDLSGSPSPASAIGELAAAGVPMMIAVMRPIRDDVVKVFARDFYRALSDGSTIEHALVAARKAQSAEQWDWSPFALVSSGQFMEDVRLAME